MLGSFPSCKVLKVSHFPHHRLSKYALAAAVLAGFLSFAKPAAARVVYTQTDVTLSGDGQLDIDLNHDGKADFSIVQTSGITRCTDGSYNVWLDILVDSKHGSVVGHDGYASALHKGVAIDSGQTFFGVEATMLFVNNCPPGSAVFGDWYQVTDRYLGLQGNNHFGWAQLSVSVSCGGNWCRATTKLSGFAFETVPGRTIKTGQTHEDSEANPDSAYPDEVGPGTSDYESKPRRPGL